MTGNPLVMSLPATITADTIRVDGPPRGVLFVPEDMTQSAQRRTEMDMAENTDFKVTDAHGRPLVELQPDGKLSITSIGHEYGIRLVDFNEKAKIKREDGEWDLNLRSQPVPAFKFDGDNPGSAIRWANRFRTSSVSSVVRGDQINLRVVDDSKSEEATPGAWLYVSPITGDIEITYPGSKFQKLFTGSVRP